MITMTTTTADNNVIIITTQSRERMPTLSECGRGYCRSNPDSFPCRVFNQLLAASRVFFFYRETPPGTESVSRSPDNPNNEVNFSLRAPSPGRGWALLNYANTFREVALNFKFVHADAFFFFFPFGKAAASLYAGVYVLSPSAAATVSNDKCRGVSEYSSELYMYIDIFLQLEPVEFMSNDTRGQMLTPETTSTVGFPMTL